jgi:cellulose synthase/poly-beta-1,6-N-acetylglucosamine synthase-like glycosyltransferase
MLDDDCALCLTPQGFNNVDAQSDIFNNLNLSFWEYMLPGTDALGYIACTGTNFCLRCAPLADCGFFPTWTITEDYALGMILKAKVRMHARLVWCACVYMCVCCRHCFCC